jgi:hypothetical protein
MSVWDEDLTDDELIGQFSIPVESFMKNKELNAQEVSVPLIKRDPHLNTESKLKSMLSFRVIWSELLKESDGKELESISTQSRTHLPVAALSVLVDSATGLDTCKAKVRSPELRPLVKINIGNQVCVTSVKRRTGNPVWEESYHFLLYNPKIENISIEVIDMYNVEERQLLPLIPLKVGHFGKFADNIGLSSKGLVLGFCTIPMTDILNKHNKKMEGTYRLEGYVENGHIRLLMSIRLIKFDSIISDNIRKPRIPLSQIITEPNHKISTINTHKKETKTEKNVSQEKSKEEKEKKNMKNWV